MGALALALVIDLHPVTTVAGFAFQAILAAINLPLTDHCANGYFHAAAGTILYFCIPFHFSLH